MHHLLHQFGKLCTPLLKGLQRGDRVAVAVSGGADSVALLRLLQLASEVPPEDILVLHFDHALRPSSSDDARFVADLCRKTGTPCQIGRWRKNRNPRTPEADSRRVRYAFLKHQAHRRGARWLLVAHTADDQAETVLHHVLRGSGLQGLAGIPRLRCLSESLTLFRPLLSTRRTDLRSFLQSIDQGFREDPTNSSLTYTRNRLRHELVPLAHQILHNDIIMSLCTTGKIAHEQQEFIKTLAQNWIEKDVTFTQPSGCILDRTLLRKVSPVLIREIFVQIWKELHWGRGSMTYEHWDRLRELSQTGEDHCDSFPGGIGVRVCGARIELSASRWASHPV